MLQLFVFAYQAKKLDETVKASAEDSKDMKQSIAEATRAADAMEEFAEAAAISANAATEIVANNKDTMTRLLRAYFGIIWMKDDAPMGVFTKRHNDADTTEPTDPSRKK